MKKQNKKTDINLYIITGTFHGSWVYAYLLIVFLI